MILAPSDNYCQANDPIGKFSSSRVLTAGNVSEFASGAPTGDIFLSTRQASSNKQTLPPTLSYPAILASLSTVQHDCREG